MRRTSTRNYRQWGYIGFNGGGSDTSRVPHGEPYAGKLHVRFDEGAGVPHGASRSTLHPIEALGAANSGSDFFFVYRIKGLKELSEEQQQDIGRSLCDAAIMNAHNALNVVAEMAQGNIEVPVKVRVGYCDRFFTKEVMEVVVQKEHLCRNSIEVLFHLPLAERIHIETTLIGVLDSVLKMDHGKAFVDVYECIRQKVLA